MAQSIKELREQVEKEINDHKNWCSSNCDTFLPQCYRSHRIIDGMSAKQVQKDYDLCHVFR